jgi:hypothetical protein
MPDETAMTIETPAPQAPPPAAEKPAAPASAPPTDQPVATTITFSDLKAMLEKNAELDRRLADEQAKRQEAEQRAIRKDIEEGRAKELMERLDRKSREDAERQEREYQAKLEAERQRFAADQKRAADEKVAAEQRARAIEQRIRKTTLDRDLAQALSGHNLVPGGAQQLSALWERELTTVEDGDVYATRSNDGKTVAEFVASRLAQPEYAHFTRSRTQQGGTLAGPGSSAVQPQAPPPFTAPTAPATEAPQFRNFGDAVLAQMKEAGIKYHDSNSDPMLPFALKPRGR